MSLVLVYLGQMVQAKCHNFLTQMDCSEIEISSELPACGPFASASDARAKNATVFASIGDFGLLSECQLLVNQLLHKLESQFGLPLREQFPTWNLDDITGFAWVLSLGDNAYWSGSCTDFSESMAPLYGDWMGDFSAASCNATIPATIDSMSSYKSLLSTHGARLLPCLGNHDWDLQYTLGTEMPYFKYFPYVLHLESQSRFPVPLHTRQSSGTFVSSDQLALSSVAESDPWYGAHYETMLGDRVYLVVLNSNFKNTSTLDYQSELQWAKSTLQRAKLEFSTWEHPPFVILLFHHPSYSTAQHDPLSKWMRYDWGSMGVDGRSFFVESKPQTHARTFWSREQSF